MLHEYDPLDMRINEVLYQTIQTINKTIVGEDAEWEYYHNNPEYDPIYLTNYTVDDVEVILQICGPELEDGISYIDVFARGDIYCDYNATYRPDDHKWYIERYDNDHTEAGSYGEETLIGILDGSNTIDAIAHLIAKLVNAYRSHKPEPAIAA